MGEPTWTTVRVIIPAEQPEWVVLDPDIFDPDKTWAEHARETAEGLITDYALINGYGDWLDDRVYDCQGEGNYGYNDQDVELIRSELEQLGVPYRMVSEFQVDGVQESTLIYRGGRDGGADEFDTSGYVPVTTTQYLRQLAERMTDPDGNEPTVTDLLDAFDAQHSTDLPDEAEIMARREAERGVVS